MQEQVEHPRVKPALRRLWRDGSTLQLGVDPRRAVVLRGVTPEVAAFLLELDGTADRSAALRRAAARGLDPRTAGDLLERLARHDALTEGSATERAGIDEIDRERLAPDLATVSLTHPGPRSAAAVLDRRGRATVAVEGIGRVGNAVVALLAAAGVGRVVALDPRPLRARDLGPAGAGRAELGLPRGEAAVVAARRTAPGVQAEPSEPPALTVLSPDSVVDPVRRDRLSRAGRTHLPVTVLEGGGVVGPLVVPGVTPCLGCVEQHHTDRDPDWPVLLAQLTPDSPTASTCDVTLATMLAAVACRIVLSSLDGVPVEPGLAYALSAGETVPRPRTYTFHPTCGCRWDRQA